MISVLIAQLFLTHFSLLFFYPLFFIHLHSFLELECTNLHSVLNGRMLRMIQMHTFTITNVNGRKTFTFFLVLLFLSKCTCAFRIAHIMAASWRWPKVPCGQIKPSYWLKTPHLDCDWTAVVRVPCSNTTIMEDIYS